MAEMSIRLVRDPETGTLQVRIGLTSDEDATPSEHERRHRQLVEKLLPRLCGVEVERERPAREPVVG